MAISDEMVAALRSYITALHTGSSEAFDISDQRFAELRQTGDIDGLGELLLAAFNIAAYRKFAPRWHPAEIIRYVAQIRGSSPEAAAGLNAAAAENQLRIALGQQVTPYPEEEARGRAQMALLGVLTVDYTADELDGLLREAREAANQTRATGGVGTV